MFQGGFVSWFIFYSFIPFALYSILLSFYPLSEMKVSRTIKPLEAKVWRYDSSKSHTAKKDSVPALLPRRGRCNPVFFFSIR